ncbi:MAG: hypothetical protein L0H93_02190 [Nocardioides sp.]|nr:hypothetical protein [Nocardioides sp.]
MSVRPDNRLDDGPMHQVTCAACSALVQVRKSSFEQTSIQWSDDALDTCVERRAASPRPGPNGETFSGCQSLRESIRGAVEHGDLPVQDDTPTPVNPEADTEASHA